MEPTRQAELPSLLWAGFPVYLDDPEGPFGDIINVKHILDMDPVSLRSLTGNGMNMPVVGSVILFAFTSCLEPVVCKPV